MSSPPNSPHQNPQMRRLRRLNDVTDAEEISRISEMIRDQIAFAAAEAMNGGFQGLETARSDLKGIMTRVIENIGYYMTDDYFNKFIDHIYDEVCRGNDDGGLRETVQNARAMDERVDAYYAETTDINGNPDMKQIEVFVSAMHSQGKSHEIMEIEIKDDDDDAGSKHKKKS